MEEKHLLELQQGMQTVEGNCLLHRHSGGHVRVILFIRLAVLAKGFLFVVMVKAAHFALFRLEQEAQELEILEGFRLLLRLDEAAPYAKK